MAEENKSYGLAWFLAGLGVGALVGIFYAPKSGKRRARISLPVRAKAPNISVPVRAKRQKM